MSSSRKRKNGRQGRRAAAGADKFLVPLDPDPAFIGRDADLKRLHRLLRRGTARGRRVALVGMGGVGKTQLAVAYAAQYRKYYPGGIYWVNAAAPLVSEFTTIAERLDLREDTDSEDEQTGQLLRAFQRYLNDHPGALIIFDNVADPRVLQDHVADVAPWDLPCHMIFTTRHHNPDDSFETYPLNVLSDDVALDLLSSKARRPIRKGGRQEDLQAARGICGALGYLPLAIVLAAAYLGKAPSVPLGDYLDRLHREGVLATTDAARTVRNGSTDGGAVQATLRFQWKALVTENARNALMVASLIRNGAHVSRATLALLAGISDEAKGGYPAPLETALNELKESSLLVALDQEAIRLHPLVREFAEKQIGDREAFTDECSKRLLKTLGEMGRIEEEVADRGLDEVLADLRLAEALGGDAVREKLRRLLRPLDREAHCLRRWDPAQGGGFFLQQVRNRCFELGMDEAQADAEATLNARGWAWLRARRRTSRESEALVRTLTGHTDSVWAVAVMPDGRTVLSASHDHTLKLWDLSSGCELRKLTGHKAEVNGVAVTRDGRFAVSASDDGTLKVWDLDNGREMRSLTGHEGAVNGVALTPKGRFIISASADCTLKVWELATERLVHTLTGHEFSVNAVAVTPDGRWILSASEDATLKVWELATGQLVRTLKGHTDAVMSVAVTPDSRLAVSASTDNTLKVWDISSGLEVRTLEGHRNWVNGVTVTPDGLLIISASSDHTLKVWELSSGREIHTLEGHTEPVTKVVVTLDNLAISTSHDKTLKIWELSSGREVFAHEGHASDVPSVSVTSEGRFIVSASWDKTLKVWELATHAHVHTLKGHNDLVMRVAVTPKDRLAISASKDRTLKVWDLSSGRELRTLAGHTWSVNSVAVTPDGLFVISASDDKTLKVWELSSGREIRTLQGHKMGVTSVTVTPDGHYVVSASEDMTVKVWDLATGCEVRTLTGHTAGVTGVLVTPDGRQVISTSEDMTIRAWDFVTGQEVYTLKGHTSVVTAVAVSLVEQLLVSVSEDTTVRVWDLAEGRLRATLEVHVPLLSCVVAPDGCTIIVGDGAGGLHVLDWIPPSAEPRRPLPARLLVPRDAIDSSPDLSAFNPMRSTHPASNAAHESSKPARADSRDAPSGRAGVPAARAEPLMPTRDEVRELLVESFPSDSDLDAFCLDFFEKVYKNFTNGMDRVTKMNFLLRDVPLTRIIEALRKRCPDKIL